MHQLSCSPPFSFSYMAAMDAFAAAIAVSMKAYVAINPEGWMNV